MTGLYLNDTVNLMPSVLFHLNFGKLTNVKIQGCSCCQYRNIPILSLTATAQRKRRGEVTTYQRIIHSYSARPATLTVTSRVRDCRKCYDMGSLTSENSEDLRDKLEMHSRGDWNALPIGEDIVDDIVRLKASNLNVQCTSKKVN